MLMLAAEAEPALPVVTDQLEETAVLDFLLLYRELTYLMQVAEVAAPLAAHRALEEMVAEEMVELAQALVPQEVPTPVEEEEAAVDKIMLRFKMVVQG
jgi:hypothetical protein